MGALFSACQQPKRVGDLPANPMVWNEAQRERAAKLMFKKYDKDNSGTLDMKELEALFLDCGVNMGDFGIDHTYDIDECVAALAEKYNCERCFKPPAAFKMQFGEE